MQQISLTIFDFYLMIAKYNLFVTKYLLGALMLRSEFTDPYYLMRVIPT